jgi:hypothetical protein
MSDKSPTANQLLLWMSKVDAAKDNAYSLFERSLKLKLDAGEWPSGYLLDRKDERCKRKKVPKLLLRPLGLLTGEYAQAKVMDHNARQEARVAARKAARDHNKRLEAKYVSALATLNGMFQGDCIAASVLTDSVDLKLNEAGNFYGALDALEKRLSPTLPRML